MEKLSQTKVQSWLSWFLRGLLILGYLILLGRLTDLQLIRGKYYKNLAEGNRIRRVPIVAPRGKILARGGEVLVGNKEIKKRVIFDSLEGYKKIEDIQGASEEEIISEWERNYIIGADFAHLSGYLGEVGEEEVGKVKAECPEKGPRIMGSLIGRSGLEEEYNCILSGINGEELVEVDSFGNRVRTLGRREPIAGRDIKTTIDIKLQEKIALLMKEEADIPLDRKGAVIVVDKEGEVLALYSSPSYDPNIFINKSSEEISTILNAKSSPLFNRVIGGKYHPGSTYKPIVAMSALEEGKIDKDFTYEDTGLITIQTMYGDFSYTNWYFTQYGGVEGEINLVRAIARSTDTFFYEIGELTGVDKLHEWSSKFGLDDVTGIDLPGEIAGLVPSREWKQNIKGERWFLGNTYHMSIGQGDIALTPIGLNSAIAAIANDGKYCPSHVVNLEELENFQFLSAKRQASLISNLQCKNLKINKNSLDLVKEGMVGACSSGGTGYTFFDFSQKYNIDIACKTGTAETDDVSEETHAWFTAFAIPEASSDEILEERAIIATVLVEKGGEGSKVAGPIMREIFDYWFGQKESTQE